LVRQLAPHDCRADFPCDGYAHRVIILMPQTRGLKPPRYNLQAVLAWGFSLGASCVARGLSPRAGG
jgi:hypothetical protein